MNRALFAMMVVVALAGCKQPQTVTCAGERRLVGSRDCAGEWDAGAKKIRKRLAKLREKNIAAPEGPELLAQIDAELDRLRAQTVAVCEGYIACERSTEEMRFAMEMSGGKMAVVGRYVKQIQHSPSDARALDIIKLVHSRVVPPAPEPETSASQPDDDVSDSTSSEVEPTDDDDAAASADHDASDAEPAPDGEPAAAPEQPDATDAPVP